MSGTVSQTLTTRRSTGSWSQYSISGARLPSEVSATIPWLPPDRYRALVHQAGAELGFGSRHDVKQPDVVVLERDLALDKRGTRLRLLTGIGLGLGGLALIAVILLYVQALATNIFVLVIPIAVSAIFAAGGLTVATESRWESEIVRVRLDPSTTKVRGKNPTPSIKGEPLKLHIFCGRVASKSTSSKTGTFRSLVGIVPSSAIAGEAARLATRLADLAPLQSNQSPSSPVAKVPRAPADPNLVPVESASARPVWYAYPRNFGYFRAVALLVPMMLLIWGPMALILPWDYQHVSFEQTSPNSQIMTAEAWSPSGSTWGELSWSTFNTLTQTYANDFPVVIAACPAGIDSILAGTCGAPFDNPAGMGEGDVGITVQNGWHLVVEENSSALCQSCRTEVSFDSPAIAWGFGMTLAGVGVVVPCAIYWIRIRRQVKSTWPP